MAVTTGTLDGEAVAGFLATVLPEFDRAAFSWEAMGGGSANPTFPLRANGVANPTGCKRRGHCRAEHPGAPDV